MVSKTLTIFLVTICLFILSATAEARYYHTDYGYSDEGMGKLSFLQDKAFCKSNISVPKNDNSYDDYLEACLEDAWKWEYVPDGATFFWYTMKKAGGYFLLGIVLFVVGAVSRFEFISLFGVVGVGGGLATTIHSFGLSFYLSGFIVIVVIPATIYVLFKYTIVKRF